MIDEYNWPKGAAGGAEERANRLERKRDPVTPKAGGVAKTPVQPQQGDGSDAPEQQQQGAIIRDWASI